MKEIYYDPKHGISGVDNLIRKTEYSKKTVEEWLGKLKGYNYILFISLLNKNLKQEQL